MPEQWSPPVTTTDRLTDLLATDVDATFPDVVDEFRDALYATALRLTRSPHDAEDLAQDTLVRAYRALAGYDAGRIRALQLRGWLWTILMNLVRNRARSRARKPPPRDLDTAAPPPATNDTAAAATASVAVAAALEALRPIQREVVVLRYVADLSVGEIAAVLDTPVGTVKSHAHRSLAKLREILGEEQP